VDITVRVTPESAEARGDGEQARALCNWLVQEAELRGHVRLAEPAPTAGTMGVTHTELLVELGRSGAALTVLASAVVTWIRHRNSDVSCTLTRPDGTKVEVEGKRVRKLGTGELNEFVAQVTRSLEHGEGGDGDTGAGERRPE
jgi:hypothetical protein